MAFSLRHQGGKRHGTKISPRENTAPLHLAFPGLGLGLAPTCAVLLRIAVLTRSGGNFPQDWN
ncbi:uncharacterized protein BO96DRAFT_407237, partial [Aspergillus niger CBS 101883]|uniref:uncharacterized protein n=1 Tax=Aspergillus lacticoffeatus (strain CBS 101883) TaxID=1450533 RepID=UPI000D7F0096